MKNVLNTLYHKIQQNFFNPILKVSSKLNLGNAWYSESRAALLALGHAGCTAITG